MECAESLSGSPNYNAMIPRRRLQVQPGRLLAQAPYLVNLQIDWSVIGLGKGQWSNGRGRNQEHRDSALACDGVCMTRMRH